MYNDNEKGSQEARLHHVPHSAHEHIVLRRIRDISFVRLFSFVSVLVFA